MIKVIDFHGSFTQSLCGSLQNVYPSIEVVSGESLETHDLLNGNPIGLIVTSCPGKPNKQMRKLVFDYSSTIPILGLSSGCLAIAEAYGGKIEHVEEVEYGKVEWIHYLEDELFAGLPNPFQGGNFYAYVVSATDFPTELSILATTKKDIIMSIRHKEHPCYGVSFAVETLLTPQGDMMLKNFINIALNYGKNNV